MKKIKNTIRNSQFLGNIYKFLSKKIHGFQRKTKIKKIQRYGPKIVGFISSFLYEYGCVWFFDMGTLLGIVRENNFIGHDLDIDVGVLNNSKDEKQKIINSLVKKGARLKYVYCVDELGVVEVSFEYKHVKFDVNFYCEENNSFVCYLLYTNPAKQYYRGKLDVAKLTARNLNAFKEVYFFGNKVVIPEKADLYLEERYGKTWNVPDKNYIYWKGPSVVLSLENQGYKIKKGCKNYL